MTLGLVLIQPQRVQRATVGNAEAALLEDAFSLATRIAVDQASGGRILEAFSEAMEATATRLMEHTSSGLAAAHRDLQALLQPIILALDALGQDTSTLEDPAQAADKARLLFERVAEIAEGLSIEQLRQYTEQALDIVQNDLGLTSAFIEEQIWALIDDIVARLQQMEPESDATARANRLEMISLLRRLKRHLYGEFRFPELNADQIASALMTFLRRSGVEPLAEKVSCVGVNVSQAAQTGLSLYELLSPNPNRSVAITSNPTSNTEGRSNTPVRLASTEEEQFCWYASWLLGDEDRPWYFWLIPGLPKDEIWIDRAQGKIIRKNRLRADQTLAEGTDIDWTSIPIFQESGRPHYAFRSFSPETLETWAFGTAVGGNFQEMLLHLISLEEGDYASNSVNSAANLGLAIYEILKRKPFPWWLEWLLIRVLGTLLASLEGMHTRVSASNWFMMWITLAGPDLGEVIIYNSTAGGIQDLILSFMTLRNHVGSPASGASEVAANYKEVSGIVDLFVGLATKLLVIAVPREDYCHPFQEGGAAKLWLLWMLLAGTGFGLLGGLVGMIAAYLSAGIFSGDEDWGQVGKELLFAVPKVWKSFWPALYLDKEGDTDDGRYNPDGTAFQGYPPAESSPYNLPYVEGLSVYVGQGNQGMFSHTFINSSQIYAYDFSMDQDEEILASRPGTVVDFFDWAPDDENTWTSMPAGVTPVPGQTTAQRWNFIVIRHDRDDTGNLLTNPDPNHDLGPGGTPVWTYAVYGHGRQGSIRDIFANRLGIPVANITPANIIGQVVSRGQPVMRAGDTGISFHNHLHMHIKSGPPPSTAPPVGGGALSNWTLPFVFREVTNFIGTDGVCKNLNFYTSDNTRVP